MDFQKWRQNMIDKYSVPEKNREINNVISNLHSMKNIINQKINIIQQERNNDLNILKKELSEKTLQFQTELNFMKKEIDEYIQKIKENNNVRSNNVRCNKRKYDEMD
jgi:hypothetical protein